MSEKTNSQLANEIERARLQAEVALAQAEAAQARALAAQAEMARLEALRQSAELASQIAAARNRAETLEAKGAADAPSHGSAPPAEGSAPLPAAESGLPDVTAERGAAKEFPPGQTTTSDASPEQGRGAAAKAGQTLAPPFNAAERPEAQREAGAGPAPQIDAGESPSPDDEGDTVISHEPPLPPPGSPLPPLIAEREKDAGEAAAGTTPAGAAPTGTKPAALAPGQAIPANKPPRPATPSSEAATTILEPAWLSQEKAAGSKGRKPDRPATASRREGTATAPASDAKGQPAAAVARSPAVASPPLATPDLRRRPPKTIAAAPGGQPRLAAGRDLPLLVDHPEPQRRLRTLFWVASSSTFSIIVHSVLFIIAAIIYLPELITVMPTLTAIQETPEELLTQVLDQRIEAATELAANVSASSTMQQGHASPLESTSEPTFDKDAVQDRGTPVNVGEMLNVGSVPGSKIAMEVPEGAPGDPQAVVDSLDEAMDRITQEILMMLQKNKVLVVWLFDESESMKDDQSEIRAKIDRVYKELGLFGATRGDALLTAIASYGEKLHIHTERPTYNLDEIRSDIEKVGVDPTGKEHMCFAVGKTINFYQRFALQGRRQLALIMVTDESGDQTTNLELLEATVAEARAARCRIYTLGREAVFGYPWCYMNWVDPKTSINYWLQIDRGPETPYVEQLQTEGFWRRWDAHPSGFGPYEQARLCRETGGIFFMLPSPEVNLVRRDDRKYALARIRPYMPDLGTREDYAEEREQSKLRSTLWKVINDLNPWREPQINLRQEYPIEMEEFRRVAPAEVQKALRYVVYLDQAEKVLEGLQRERAKEIYPRWQANYDLIYAQVLAYKVRVYQYGAYLEWFMRNPKQPALKPPNPRLTATHWDITTRQEMLETKYASQEELQKYVQKATQLFQNIMKNHEGTPWAARAQWELTRGFGVHVVQDWDDPRRGQGVVLPKL